MVISVNEKNKVDKIRSGWGHVPILYLEGREGLINKMTSQQRPKAVGASLWISGRGTVLKRDNSQGKDHEWRVLGGFRNSKEASVAGAEGASGDQTEGRSERHRGPETWSLVRSLVFYPVLGGEPLERSELKSKIVVFYSCCNKLPQLVS